MRMPSFIVDTYKQAKQQPVWAFAFLATLLLPFMIIFARVGIEICCAIMGLTFLWQSARTKQWAWLRTPFTLACIAFWAWLLLVVTPLALVPKVGWMEAGMWFRLPLMFCALRYWVLASPVARSTLGFMLGAMLVLVATDCFYQAATGMSLSGHAIFPFHRLSGPFVTPKVGAFLSKMAVPVVAFCLMAGIQEKCRTTIIGSFALLAIVIATIVLSGERSAFITILLACGTATGLLMLMEKRFRLAGLAIGAAVIALLGLLYATDMAVQERAGQMIETISHYWESDYGQLAAVGIDIGKQYPIHGTGLQGFRILCPTLVYHGTEFRGLHPHNIYVEIFSELGIPGLILLLLMIAFLVREGAQQLRSNTGMARLMPAIALGVLMQHFFPVMGTLSYFTNWGALLQWYTMSLVFTALPPKEPYAV